MHKNCLSVLAWHIVNKFQEWGGEGGAGRRKKPGGERNLITLCPMSLPDLSSGVEGRESCTFSFADHTAGLTWLRKTTSNQTRVALVFHFFYLCPFYVSWECLFLLPTQCSVSPGLDKYQVRGRNGQEVVAIVWENICPPAVYMLPPDQGLRQYPITTTGARPYRYHKRATSVPQKHWEFCNASQQPS